MAIFIFLRSLLFIPVLGLLFNADVVAASFNQSSELDGQLRSWRVYVPDTADQTAPLPLVFNFHGTGSNPDEISALNQLEALAKAC